MLFDRRADPFRDWDSLLTSVGLGDLMKCPRRPHADDVPIFRPHTIFTYSNVPFGCLISMLSPEQSRRQGTCEGRLDTVAHTLGSGVESYRTSLHFTFTGSNRETGLKCTRGF
jgi:hypothetical protein